MKQPSVHAAFLIALLAGGALRLAAQSANPVASPNSLSFTYQVNSTTPPASGKVTVTLPAAMSTVVMSVKASSPSPQGAGWLALNTDSGRTPLTISVFVNPTGLSPGNYSGSITVSTPSPYNTSTTIPVNLAVMRPASVPVVTSPSPAYKATSTTAGALAFDFTTGTTTIPTAELDVASSGDVIPFNVTAAAAASKGSGSGSAVWLRVNQTGQLPNTTTSGVAMSGSFVPITIGLDLATVAALDPGSYTGTVTITANNSSGFVFILTVTLVVSAGPPSLDQQVPIFPSSVTANPPVDPVITLYGDNFFATTVVAMQQGNSPAVTLVSRLLSRKVLQATIKASYFAAPAGNVTYPIPWTISVTNPATSTNPAPAPALTTLSLTDPKQPTITSVVNAASFLQTATQATGANPVAQGKTSISPREIISIFGVNLGPTTSTPVPPAGNPPAYPTVYSALNDPNVRVEFQIPGLAAPVYAPLLMISSNQVNCIVPLEVAVAIGSGTDVNIVVDYGTGFTPPYPATVVEADPGIFTFGGLGQGQGAVLNFDANTGSYTVNSGKTQAVKGSAISIYATGLGDLAGNTVITVTDSAGTPASVSKLMPITIDSMAITTPSLPAGVVNVAYTLTTVQAAGGKTPYTWSATGLPAGLTINAGTGVLGGTTAAPGAFTVTVMATDSSSTPNTAAKTYTLVIGPSLTITTTALPEGAVNSAYTAPNQAAQGGTAPYTWSAVPASLPPGVNLSAGGVWSGTPTTGGVYAVSITVTDSAGTPATATTTLTLVITAGLTITTAALPDPVVGVAYNTTLAAAGGTPPYRWSASGLPGGLTLDVNTGTLSGTATSAVAAAIGNGVLANSAIRLADNTCRVDIDGQPAVVSYAGTAWGAVAGLVQINAVVPPTVKAGAVVSVTVSLGGATSARRSQAGVTIGVK